MENEYRRYRKRRRNRGLLILLFVTALLGAVALLWVSIQMSGVLGAPSRKTQTGGQQQSETSAPKAVFSSAPAESGIDKTDWRLRLVNEKHPLPAGFAVETRTLPNGMEFDARAFDALMEMINDGKSEGMQFVICSGYRSVELQTELFNAEVQKQKNNGLNDQAAYDKAKTSVAVPGTSEHSLGLAADIVALDYQRLDDGYEQTPEAVWLKENSWKYGFVQRYPKGKQEITGIIFEPWHYRYVGKEAAKEITERGLCLEEYLGEA